MCMKSAGSKSAARSASSWFCHEAVHDCGKRREALRGGESVGSEHSLCRSERLRATGQRRRAFVTAEAGPSHRQQKRPSLQMTCFVVWSGWRDSNSRPLAPHASALPGCATPRTENVKYIDAFPKKQERRTKKSPLPFFSRFVEPLRRSCRPRGFPSRGH